MQYPTYADLKARVEREMDLIGEDFISSTELLDYFNRAIDQTEAKIHTIYEDYFLTDAMLQVNTGNPDVDLPANIYATKIRSLIYQNGAWLYQLKRLKGDRLFLEGQVLNYYSTGIMEFTFVIKNDSATNGVKLHLFPVPSFTASDRLHIWYIRNANRFTGADSDVCDIPEFSDYIVTYVKKLCADKEKDYETSAVIKAELDKIEEDMIMALKDMIPDGDNEIVKDWFYYWEHS